MAEPPTLSPRIRALLRALLRVLPTLGLAALSALGAACRASAATAGPPAVARLRVPAGFHVAVFSSAVPGARSMTLGDRGTLFVGTRDSSVYAVVDRDHDGVADQVFTIARGLDMPNGVAF